MSMTARHRLLVALTAVTGLALVAPAGSSACEPTEYMTAEQLESGRYDTSTPEWYDSGSGAPHSHDAPAAGAPTDEPSSAQPARDATGSAPSTTRERPASGSGSAVTAKPVPRPSAPASPARPATPRDVVPAPAAVHRHVPMPVAAPVAGRGQGQTTRETAIEQRRAAARRAAAAAARRAAARHRAAERRAAQRRATIAVQRQLLAPESALVTTAAPSDDAGARRSLAIGGIAVLLLALGTTAAVARRRPANGGATGRGDEPTPAPLLGDDEIEAALQELLAESEAARSTGELAGASRP